MPVMAAVISMSAALCFCCSSTYGRSEGSYTDRIVRRSPYRHPAGVSSRIGTRWWADNRMCLEALKDLVLRLAIDDFGTGSNSLSCFRTCTMDVVKIDTFFIDRITLDVEGEAMVRGIIDLSRALGLTTIAEGVERHDQFALLHDLRCDGVQGYLFAKPMPGTEFPGSLAIGPDDGVSHNQQRGQLVAGGPRTDTLGLYGQL